MTNPFDELGEFEQRAAIDIAVAATIMVTRLPMLGPEVFEVISDHFADHYHISRNTAKYAFRSLGKELFHSSWDMQVTKNVSAEVVTQFTPGSPLPDTAL